MGRLFLLLIILALCFEGYAQHIDGAEFSVNDQTFSALDRRSVRLSEGLERFTSRCLRSLHKKEERLKKRLQQKDSALAGQVFGNGQADYDSLQQVLAGKTPVTTHYNGQLDSVGTALRFLQQQAATSQQKAALQTALQKQLALNEKWNQSNFINSEIQKRTVLLEHALRSTGWVKELSRYRRQAAAFRTQLNGYGQLLNDPDRAVRTLLDVASRPPAFQSFFARYSQLGQLFRLPGAGAGQVEIQGLQTRAMIQEAMGTQLGLSSPAAQQSVSNGIADAQQQLRALRDRLSTGGTQQEMAVPGSRDALHTKTFLQRMEVGANVQSVKSNWFFPATTDIGFSLGYRFAPKIVAGIGGSYKMGWGRDWRHIALTHQGVGLRTFADIQAKGSYWITGGGEWNYRSAFQDLAAIKHSSGWQRSALMGISKKYKAGKFKGNLQVLYDFLHNRQVPAGPAFVVRTGYQLK